MRGRSRGPVDHRASVPKSVVNPQSVRLASAFFRFVAVTAHGAAACFVAFGGGV